MKYKRMKYLDEALYHYSRTDFYPFHMPGHKRQMKGEFLLNPYETDITEITDFDNLHHARGILKENQELGAKLYKADKTYFLINGSTAGILAAVSACTSPGGRLLMSRNCHKAVYHSAYLRGLKTAYLYPACDSSLGLNGGISAEDVEMALKENPDTQAVLVTSPSYDGIVSDIEKIAGIVHRYGIPLLVDEAHGAHFPFHREFPASALYKGADVVIHSLHKTLPAFTQTALLHLQGQRVSRERIEMFLGMYQTSSPSYVLMAGISRCLRFLEREGEEGFREYVKNLEWCRSALKELKHLAFIGEEIKGSGNVYDFDKSKLIISTKNTLLSGPKLHQILRETYHLELEMEAEHYVLALTSVMDSREGFERLVQALCRIDRDLDTQERQERDTQGGKKYKDTACFEKEEAVVCFEEAFMEQPQQVCSIAEAIEGEKETLALEDSEGRIAGEYAYLYPPGIPVLVPGERIGRDFISQAERLRSRGMYLQGMRDDMQKNIQVMKKEKRT